jgi:hypothetical protein
MTSRHPDRPESEAAAQAKLDGRKVDKGPKHEGFHLGDTTDRRRGAGAAGEGSNRSVNE